MILKYNANTNYLTKDLKGVHSSNNLSLLNLYLGEKGPSVKIELPTSLKIITL